jgi:hypothetical protein
MKRIILFIPLVFLAVGAFAQTRSREERQGFEPPATVTVSGTLEAVNARIAVKSGDLTYFVFGIDRLVGFVAGLNEGARVTLEGYEAPASAVPEYRALWVSKLSFNGKDYDLSPPSGASAPDRGPSWGPGPGFGRGHWGMGPGWGSRRHW